jgi:AraC-like DNA-binding protein
MLYREHAPHPALSTLVRCYWTLSLPAGLPATAAQQVLAEGVELAFNLADPIVIASDERRSVKARRTCLSGPMTRPMLLRPTGRVEIVGVCFRPGGAYPFVRAPARELQDRQLEVEDVWGARGAAIVEQIRDEGLGTPERISLLDRQLLDRLEARRTRTDVAVAAALRLIDERCGRVRVAGVARAVGVSSRQLERSFLERVGLSPRQLCRSLRFKSVFGHLTASPGDPWTSVALACGYCDQSHLIRDFKRYTGASPEAYFARPGPGSLFLGNF